MGFGLSVILALCVWPLLRVRGFVDMIATEKNTVGIRMR